MEYYYKLVIILNYCVAPTIRFVPCRGVCCEHMCNLAVLVHRFNMSKHVIVVDIACEKNHIVCILYSRL